MARASRWLDDDDDYAVAGRLSGRLGELMSPAAASAAARVAEGSTRGIRRRRESGKKKRGERRRERGRASSTRRRRRRRKGEFAAGTIGNAGDVSANELGWGGGGWEGQGEARSPAPPWPPRY